jgi:hypothetical protein
MIVLVHITLYSFTYRVLMRMNLLGTCTEKLSEITNTMFTQVPYNLKTWAVGRGGNLID